MDKKEFSRAIRLPKLWIDRNLYPDDFFEAQYSEFQGASGRLDDHGYVLDGEHYRNGLYWYWLRNGMDKSLLVEMIGLEPDSGMRAWLLKSL